MKFLRNFPAVATLVAAALLSTACGSGDGAVNIPSGAIPDGKPAVSAQPTGTIRGHVLLKGDLPKPGTDKINQDQTTCGNEVSLPRIAVGDDKGIQDTFVFL